MSTGLQVDVAGWKRQMRAVAKQWNIPVKTIMRYEMGLWAKDLMRKSYPKTYAQGRSAVKRDIMRLFVALPEGYKEFPIANAPSAGYHTGIESPTGAIWAAKTERYMPSATPSELERVHNSHRGKDGKVSKYEFRSRALKRGGMLNIRLYHVNAQARAKYIKLKQKNVGKLKAGWVAMAARFGGKIPAWVNRQAVKQGRATDSMGDNGTGWLEGVNMVRYASQKLGGVARAAAMTRQRDLDKHLHKRMEAVVKYANAQRG